jgi:hypothetical protein
MDYKKYSLENLENWLHDLMSCDDVSSEEIYDTIQKVVTENYHHHKYHASRAYELMEKLNGSVNILSCDKDDKSPECQKAWNDFWEEHYYPEESFQYTEETLNAMCDQAASDEEKKKCQEYNLREAEYYNKRAELDLSHSNHWYEYDRNDPSMPNPFMNKVTKWVLPVEVDGLTGECYVNLPDDLLEAADLKEGDQVEWVDRKNGSFELRKVKNVK